MLFLCNQKYYTMLFLLLSIFCSVSVGIIFKISRKFDITISQVIKWNYTFALLLCYLFFEPDLNAVNSTAPWGVYTSLMLLLPSVFILLAVSIKHIGIVKIDAAQRLSLIIPILAAWFIFMEDFNVLKLAGLAVGIPAIVMILIKKDKSDSKNWLYPTLVLLGFGVIDVLFKQIALYKDLPYTTSLFVVFCGALITAIGIIAYEILFMGKKLGLINLAFGALVGIFNFGNILFYLKAHQAFAENPSTVFAAMNMGVIVLGSLAGILIFKEKLSKLNYFGLFFALIAIAFITLSQIYK